MKFGQILALSVAVAASALAVTISSDYMASIKAPKVVQVAPKVEMTKVVTAATMIGHGRIIKPSDLKLTKWPANAVPKGSFSNLIDILGTEHGRNHARALDSGSGTKRLERGLFHRAVALFDKNENIHVYFLDSVRRSKGQKAKRSKGLEEVKKEKGEEEEWPWVMPS